MTRKRILLPIDLDAQSDAALEIARNIATRMNVMISCLYVIEDQSIRVKNDLSQDAKLKQRREAEDKLSERVNSILNESRTSFELMVSSGNVREKILEKSRDLNAQLIIMGRSKPKAANKK
jgi:nucleotide-binding universal stress UspA family protein